MDDCPGALLWRNYDTWEKMQMLALRMMALITLSTFAVGAGGASGCRAQSPAQQSENRPAGQDSDRRPIEIKVLAEGFHSSVNDTFLAVVRDADTYAELSQWAGNLPSLDADFFKKNAVVAAFLGERNTGGYSVQITPGANGEIRVDEKKPGKGMMVTQMITAPFKVVSVSLDSVAPMLIALDSAWRQKLQTYRVTGGTFTMSGGFTGTSEQFPLEGEMRVLRGGNFVTFAFQVLSPDRAKKRSLVGFETGVIGETRQITIRRMSADSLINSPSSGLKATGRFTDKKLSLSFLGLPSYVADGYSGTGNIEAELTSPV
jgi:hypothetical protein